MKDWTVTIDSPELPRKITCEVSAMVESEAKVYGAEAALLICRKDLTAKFTRRRPENQVLAVAKYAEAAEK